MYKYSGVALAALLAISCLPEANAQPMGYSVAGGRAAEINRILSARYDHLLQISSRFRTWRMWKECRIITWPGLREHCIASFDEYEPILPGYH